MTPEQSAQYLKDKILEIETNKQECGVNNDRRIVTVHVDPELFLKMAYLYVGMHSLGSH